MSAPPWQEPDLSFLGGQAQLRSVPQFPLPVLGPFWSSFIKDNIAGSRKLRPDFYANTLLAVTAGLTGNARASVLPPPAATSDSPATLWTLNVGYSGSGKSAPVTLFQNLLREIADEDPEAPTIFVDDVTQAAIQDRMLQNPHAIMMLADEIAGWWRGFDRTGGEQMWLESWNGNAPKAVHRGRGRNAQEFTIPRFNLSVAGGTQPAHLDGLTSGLDSGFVQRWLFAFPDPPKGPHARTGNQPDLDKAKQYLARIYALDLASMTETRWKPLIINTSSAAAKFLEDWLEQTQADLLPDERSQEGGWLAKCWHTARRLSLTLELLWWASHEASNADRKAVKRAGDYAAMADPQRNENAPQRQIAMSKLAKHCDTHGLDFDDLMAGGNGVKGFDPNGPKEVGLRAMSTACELLRDYYYPHLRRVLGAATPVVEVEAAKSLVRHFVVEERLMFNERDLRKNHYGSIHPHLHGRTAAATEHCREVLDFLADRSIIRKVMTTTGGRPKSDYEVNPIAVTRARKILSEKQ